MDRQEGELIELECLQDDHGKLSFFDEHISKLFSP
jgi:hypothetical protein